MKYLKSYKLFESISTDIKSDIEDMLLELTDYQIEYDVTELKYYKNGINGEDCLRVYIKDNQDRLFRLEDIMDVLLRIKDYLKDSDYSIDLGIPNSDDYLDIDYFMEEFSGDELYNLNIFIYNNPRISFFKRKYTLTGNDLFESRFVSKFEELKEVISTIKDICQEFKDNNCNYQIEPSNDIRIKVMALQGKGEVFQDINMPFYIDIDIDRRIIKQDEKRSGFGPFPEWFIETCRRIEDYMLSEGFKTLPSVRYPVDWENLDAIDELSEITGMIQKVKLEFIPNEALKTYKIFESDSNKEMLYNIEDIFREIEDLGFKVEYNRGGVGEVTRIYIEKFDVYGFSDEPRPLPYIPGQEFVLALQHLISYVSQDYDIEIESICNSQCIDHLSSKSEDGLIENDVRIIGDYKVPIDYIKIIISNKE